MKVLILIILFTIYCAPLRAERVESILFNLGNHTEFFNAVQNDDKGGMRKFEFAPTVGIGAAIPLNSKVFHFLPEFNWVLPKKAETSRIIKNLLMFRADFGYDPLDWLRLRLGTSLMLRNIHGRGGSVEGNNGNETSTFYYPDENRTAINNTLDLGVEFKPNQDWGIRLQSYVYSILQNDRRQISYTILGTYYWEQVK
jgi:hypothetical protein